MSNRELQALGVLPKTKTPAPAPPLASVSPAVRHLQERTARQEASDAQSSAPDAADIPRKDLLSSDDGRKKETENWIYFLVANYCNYNKFYVTT